MLRLSTDAAAAEILAPVRALLDDAASRLPAVADLTVTVGDAPGFASLAGSRLVLSTHLAGPAMAHPDEDPTFGAMDRWRRAGAAVLEGLVLRALSEASGVDPGAQWWWHGLAVDQADQAAPGWQIAVPDLLTAWRTGAIGLHPRAGVAVCRAWRLRGEDPWARCLAAIRGQPPGAEEWLALGVAALSAEGIVAGLPAPVPRVAAADIPLVLAPWSWRPLDVPAHPRGGRVRADGDGAVVDAWAPARTRLQTLAAAAALGSRLEPDVGGPVGRWEATSAHGFGQVFGIRGISFHLGPSGRLRVVMADAFAGPLAAIEVAEQVGTSGVADGRWHVAGPHSVGFSGIEAQGLTMHGRTSGAFRVPAQGFGMLEWIRALQERPWSWALDGDKLVMTGHVMGGAVEMWWRPEP